MRNGNGKEMEGIGFRTETERSNVFLFGQVLNKQVVKRVRSTKIPFYSFSGELKEKFGIFPLPLVSCSLSSNFNHLLLTCKGRKERSKLDEKMCILNVKRGRDIFCFL